jgi:hypothetical protein
MVACSGGVNQEQARASFCLHTATIEFAPIHDLPRWIGEPLPAALEADAYLFDQSGDSGTAVDLRHLAGLLRSPPAPAEPDLSVFVRDDITEEQLAHLADVIPSLANVESATYESKEEAFERFKELFKDQPELIEDVSPEALPASFRVTLTDPAAADAVRSQLEGELGVETVRAQGAAAGLVPIGEAAIQLTKEIRGELGCTARSATPGIT